MDMQTTGYSEKELLVIRSEKYDFLLNISGKFGNYKADKLNYKEDEAKIKVIGEKIIVKTINGKGDLELNNTERMIPTFYEDGVYDITFECDENYNIIQMGKQIELLKKSKRYPIRVGKFEFKSDIGYSSFYIKDRERVITSFTIEVFPTKINYKEDYKVLLDEVNNNMEALVFDMFDKTYLSAKFVEYSRTNNEFLSILKVIFNELEKNLMNITRNFKHNIETLEKIERINRVRKLSNKTIGYLRTHKNVLENHSQGFVRSEDEKYIPNKVIGISKKTTIDIFENRYIKYAIKGIISRLITIENILIKKDEKNIYLEFISNKKKRLNNILRNKFNEISDLNYNSEVTLALQRTPVYKEFYKIYTLLRKGLDFSEGIMTLTPKKMYKLYEIWCYIKLNNIIKELGFNVVKSDIVKTTNNGLTLNLTQDNESKVVYIKENKTVELLYNKSYGKLPTTNQRPDIVLIIKEDDKKDRIYIFDAKYKIKVYKNRVSVEENDINIMHRYRDSIVSYMSDIKQFQYKIFGAYVMFPYEDEEKFKNDKYYKSIEKVNIGAFPMLPNKNNLIFQYLNKILNEDREIANKRRVITKISVN
ncbi:DUF2357 domain-containing protein [Clostridium sp.]|uniref:DUF2357 domain-containing protein n=1 Tax=Clostridium sp. TaxID=1506 RepID=UPI002FCB0FC1